MIIRLLSFLFLSFLVSLFSYRAGLDYAADSLIPAELRVLHLVHKEKVIPNSKNPLIQPDLVEKNVQSLQQNIAYYLSEKTENWSASSFAFQGDCQNIASGFQTSSSMQYQWALKSSSDMEKSTLFTKAEPSEQLQKLCSEELKRQKSLFCAEPGPLVCYISQIDYHAGFASEKLHLISFETKNKALRCPAKGLR